MTRWLLIRIGAVLLAVSVTYGRADDPPYTQSGRVPLLTGMNRFVYDPVGRRLYVPKQEGVYWIDAQAPEPRLNGPLPPKHALGVAIAQEVGRLYFAGDDGLGYLDLRGNHAPTMLRRQKWRSGRFVYEHTRRAIYAPARVLGDTVAVYDADTGEQAAEITVPDRGITVLGAVPGQVFFTVATKFGLYVIDAATHVVTPWPVDGKSIGPSAVELDPAGRYMIAQYDRHLVAIDIPSATVVAQLSSAGLADFAFDPARHLVVVATREPPDHPRVRLRTYSIGATGFTQVAELTNPVEDSAWLISMHDGFLQRSRDSLLFWRPGRASTGARPDTPPVGVSDEGAGPYQ